MAFWVCFARFALWFPALNPVDGLSALFMPNGLSTPRGQVFSMNHVGIWRSERMHFLKLSHLVCFPICE